MMYTIYMLPRDHAKCFMSYAWTMRHGGVNIKDYERAYTGYISPRETVQETLEAIFMEHNADDRPEGRRIRSMSVSDLVELEGSGTWFCASVGFKRIV